MNSFNCHGRYSPRKITPETPFTLTNQVAMRQLNQAEAESFSSGQATEMAHVLDLQAQWENHRDDPTKSTLSLHDLRVRQKAFQVFQTALRNYGEKYLNAHLPDVTPNTPERLAVWCRVLHSIFLRADDWNPAHTMAKVYRLADRIALRLAAEPVWREKVDDVVSAVRGLDIVIAWCDALVLLAQSGSVKFAPPAHTSLAGTDGSPNVYSQPA